MSKQDQTAGEDWWHTEWVQATGLPQGCLGVQPLIAPSLCFKPFDGIPVLLEQREKKPTTASMALPSSF